jgi:hypothetical protein
MSIAGGAVSILDWLKDKLPIPNRLEAIKNQISQLEKERQDLLNVKATVKSSKRISWIDDRLKLLRIRLQNANDSR